MLRRKVSKRTKDGSYGIIRKYEGGSWRPAHIVHVVPFKREILSPGSRHPSRLLLQSQAARRNRMNKPSLEGCDLKQNEPATLKARQCRRIKPLDGPSSHGTRPSIAVGRRYCISNQLTGYCTATIERSQRSQGHHWPPNDRDRPFAPGPP